MVRHEKSGNAAWAQVRVFFLAPPFIAVAPLVVDMNARITGTGHTDIAGNTVEVFRDAITGKIGGGPVNQSTGAWFADVVLPAGRVGITASQLYSGVQSVRAATVYFNVRPPKFGGLTVSYEEGKTILSGARYDNTRVQIHISGDGVNAQFTVPVGSGSWRVEVPVTYLPGRYTYASKQSISDGGSGWIDSAWSDTQSVEIKPRKLTLNTPSLSGQKPTFTGAGGFNWGTAAPNRTTIEIQLNGQKHGSVPDVYLPIGGNSWTTTATADLPPGTFTVIVRQLVNGVWSEPTQLASPLAIKPNKTAFTEPDGPSGQRPRISLTAWPLATVRLFDNQNNLIKEHAADGSGIWRHPADKNWNPGPHTVKATQTFGGLPSEVATHTFTVKTPVALITLPPGNEVSPQPVITGVNGLPGSWVVIYSAVGARPELGRGEVQPDGSWSAPLAKQPLGALPIFAVQVFNTHESDPGARLDLTVVVPVPKFDPIPPKPGRTFNLTGTGFFGATVEIRRKGVPTPLAKDIEVRPGGTWTVQLKLDVGPIIIVAIHRYENQFTSEESEDCVLTVVPNVPVIDSPLNGQPLGAMLTISGFGVAGDDVYVHRIVGPYNFPPIRVAEDGTWSAHLQHNIATSSGFKVLAKATGNLDSEWSEPLTMALLGIAPQITEPRAADYVGVRPWFSGLAVAGAIITITSRFNTDDVLASAEADESGRWTVQGNKDLPVGPARVAVRQTVEGKDSEWAISPRFMVERMPANFEAPTVTFPRRGQVVGRWPMFEGRGVPGSEISLYKKGDSNAVVGRAWVDRQGAWAVRSQIELAVADNFECSVHQTRDGVISKSLSPDHLFNVRVPGGGEALIIDTPSDDVSQVLEQQPVFSGSGIPGAEVEVYSGSTVLAKTRVNAQGHWSVRSEVVLQAGTHTIEARQFMDDIHFAPTGRVTFTVAEKLELPVIVSPVQGAHISPYGVIEGTALPGTTVRLHKGGDGHTIWGHGDANDQGEWLIVLAGLPVGNFQLTGEGRKDQLLARWMPVLDLKVINAG
ncbi:hypothetical protein PMI21_03046 [Pseudomonas sp. GM18]|nr:hypothetical protein PMI21_03046 [Pseudomonas sp. GM18]